MTDIRVLTTDPGEATLLADGSVFNVLLLAKRRLEIPLGEGVLGLVGAVVNDYGRPGRAVELEGGIDDLRSRYGGFKSFVGDGVASGYEGNLSARAKGASAPRVVLQPVDLAFKDKTITDPTAVDLKVVLARGARAFTVEADDDVFTSSGHGLAVDDTIQLVTLTGGTGAAVATTYYVISVPDANSFKLSATQGGMSLTITLDGSGTWRPISVAAGLDLAPRTVPAGSRLSTGAFIVRTLEDVVWAEGEFGAKSVRIGLVSGAPAAINALALSNDFLDLTADVTREGNAAGSSLVVATTATTVPHAINPAELLLRYERAFEALLDTPAGQAVNVLACDRDESGIGDLLAAHCVAARARGYFRFGVISPPVGTSAANGRSNSGDGVGRSTLNRSLVAYVHPGVRRVCRKNKRGRAVKGQVRRGRWARLGGCSWCHRGSQTCQLVMFGSQDADVDGLVQVSGRSGAFVHVLGERRRVRPRRARSAGSRWEVRWRGWTTCPSGRLRGWL